LTKKKKRLFGHAYKRFVARVVIVAIILQWLFSREATAAAAAEAIVAWENADDGKKFLAVNSPQWNDLGHLVN
jgi:hypothetical protein